MAEQLLKSVLSGEIDADRLVRWLKLRGAEDDGEFPCSRTDFALSFVAAVRNQTESILQYNDASTPYRGEAPEEGEEKNTKGARRSSTQLFPRLQESSPSQDSRHGGHPAQSTPVKTSLGSDCLLSPITPGRGHATPGAFTDHSFVVLHNSGAKQANQNSRMHHSDGAFHNNSVRSEHDSQTSFQHRFNKPSSSRTNICIGDFITPNRSADRGTGKKKRFARFSNRSSEDGPAAKEGQPELDIGDSAAFPEIGARRRINPTRVAPAEMNSTFPGSSSRGSLKFGVKYEKPQSEAFKSQIFQPEEEAAGFSTERTLLKTEKEKLLSKFSSISPRAKPAAEVLSRLTPSKSVLKGDAKSIFVTPDFNLVSNTTSLDTLAVLYSAILDCNLVLNITSEIYYLISILVSQQLDVKKSVTRNVDKVVSSDGLSLLDESIETSVASLCDGVKSCELEGDESLLADCIKLEDSAESLGPKTGLPNVAIKQEEVGDNTADVADVLTRPEIAQLLSTIHNCVYFAVRALELQIPTLEAMLDAVSLRLLQDNWRVAAFHPPLAAGLARVQARNPGAKPTADSGSAIMYKNVCFNSDTDSADNFPDLQSFYAFKKQRDMFYEIYSAWGSSSSSKTGEPSGGRRGAVRSLLALSVHPANLAHLAALFRGQLLAAPHHARLPEELGGGKVDADRLSKLTERLTSRDGHVEGVFTHHQLFFRDFLLLADNASFHHHVADSLTQEICRLEGTTVFSADSEVTEGAASHFLQRARSLQTLARFLGLLLALPHLPPAGEGPPRERVLHAQIAVRDTTQPPLDLIGILGESERRHRLTLTIPWLAVLLSMLDYASLRLPYYGRLCHALFRIYLCTHSLPDAASDAKGTPQMSTNAKFLIRLSLGWLFDMPQFPQEAYYAWLRDNAHWSNLDKNSLGNDHLQQSEGGSPALASLISHSDPGSTDAAGPDGRELVDGGAVLALCPFLRELRALLAPGAGGPPRPPRHITPLSSSLRGDRPASRDNHVQVPHALLAPLMGSFDLNSRQREWIATLFSHDITLAPLLHSHIVTCTLVISVIAFQ